MQQTLKPDIPSVRHDEVSGERTSIDSVREVAIGGDSVNDLPRGYFASIKLIASSLAFVIGYTVAFWAYVMVATSISLINADIGPSSNYIWVLNAITVAQCVSFAVAGRLADLFGRRWYFVGSSGLAFIGYLIASRANSINMLIGANVIIGIGSAVQTSGTVILGELLPQKYRFLAYGLSCGTFGPVSMIAPAISRLLNTETEQKWRWIYYILSIMTFIAFLLQVFCYHPPKFNQLHTRASKQTILKKFDYVGLVLFSGSMVSLLLGLSWGGTQYPWKSAQVIATIVLGGAGFASLALWEHFFHPAYAMLPLRLFQNRSYVGLTVCACVGSMIFYALNILFPTQTSVLFQASPSRAGWITCTLTGGAIFGQTIAGVAVHRIRYIKWQLVFTCMIFTSLIGGMAAVDGSNLALAVSLSLFGAIAIGWMETICISGAPLMIDEKDIGLSNGVQNSFRTGSASLANAIYITILNNKVQTNMVKYVVPAALGAGLPPTSMQAFIMAIASGDMAALASIAGVTPEVIQAAQPAAVFAYFKSFQMVYYASIAFGGAAIIAALVCDTKQIDSTLTTHVSRRLQGIEGKVAIEQEATRADISNKKEYEA